MSDDSLFDTGIGHFDPHGLYGFDVEFECHVLATQPMPPMDALEAGQKNYNPHLQREWAELAQGDCLRVWSLARDAQPAAFALDSRLLNCIGTTPSEIYQADTATYCHILRYAGKSFADARQIKWIAVLAGVLAEATNGVIRDMAAYSLWGRREWETYVLRPIAAGETPIPPLITLHKEIQDDMPTPPDFSDSSEIPAIAWIHSHGLVRFGVPELEILNVPDYFDDAAQTLMFDLAVRMIQGTHRLQPGMIFGSETGAKCLVVPADPVGRLAVDEHFHGPALRLVDETPIHPEFSDSLLRFLDDYEMFLRQQLVVPVEHDEEVLEAHRKAAERLPWFRDHFKGAEKMPPVARPEFIVKIGFPIQTDTGDEPGSEWMWVTIDSWRGDNLTGQLNSKPVWRLDMRPGDRVTFKQGDIFDWIIVRDGAITDGNFLQQILERRRRSPMPSDDAATPPRME